MVAGSHRWLRGALGAAIVACSAWQPRVGSADPVLEVRSSTRLAMRVAAGTRGLEAYVSVVDDVGEPVRAATVQVFAPPCADATCRTGEDGTCVARLDGCAADSARARFEDDGRNESAEVTERVGGEAVAPRLQLVLEGGAEVALERDTLFVRATIGGDTPATPVFRDELGTPLRSTQLAAGRHALPTAQLGPVGVGRLLAEVRTDDGRALHAERMIVRTRTLSLRLGRSERGLQATLRDSAGPVAGEVIVLERDGTEAGSGVTDAHGQVEFPLESGAHVHRAVHPPQRPGRGFAVSAPLQTNVRGLAHWLPIAFGATLFVTLAVALRRRRVERTQPEARAATAIAAPPPAAVEHAARTAWVANRDDVTLRVIGREDGAALPYQVSVDGSPAQNVEAGESFTRTLTPGTHRLVVSAAGRVEEVVDVSMPHRGEFAGVLVRLEMPRTFARRAVEHAAESAADDRAPASLLTLRDAAAKLPSLPEEVIVATERAVFAAEPPTAAEARSVVDATRAAAPNAARARGSSRDP